MKKIPSLFQRNYDGDRQIRDEVVPGCEWVLAGEGIPTVKWDGTCCKVENGQLFRRYDAKHGKPTPAGFVAAQEPDPVTGHWPGWISVEVSRPADKWHVQALGNSPEPLADGTYELVGPKVQGNPHGFARHVLIRHGYADPFEDLNFERTFEGIRAFLASFNNEGVVFHHPDGRMAKVRRKDFGYKWPIKAQQAGK